MVQTAWKAVVLALLAAVVGLIFNQMRAEGIALGRSVVEVQTEEIAEARRQALRQRQERASSKERNPPDTASEAPNSPSEEPGNDPDGGPEEAPPEGAVEPADGMTVDPANLDFRVSTEEVRALERQGQAFFLDARPRLYYEQGHLPGARLLPPADYDSLIFEIAPELPFDTPIIVYCDGGDCSASLQVAQRLIQEEGYPNVHVYEEGYPAWKNAGYPVTEGPTP